MPFSFFSIIYKDLSVLLKDCPALRKGEVAVYDLGFYSKTGIGNEMVE